MLSVSPGPRKPSMLALGRVFVPDGGGDVEGISVDGDGDVWAVDRVAHEFDPASGPDVDPSSLHTHSDVTGWALQNTACAPEG